jgi:8-oxo-dGTP diphosphatase
MSVHSVRVACGVVIRDGRVLVSRRPTGSHLEGTWEFPGGKVRPDEDALAALARELREEIGLEVRRATLLAEREHRYPDREVEVSFFLCEVGDGPAVAAEGQELRWVGAAELERLPTPAANREVIALLSSQLAD